MKRIRRWLFIALLVTSIVTCLISAILWPVSYHVEYSVFVSRGSWNFDAWERQGKIGFDLSHFLSRVAVEGSPDVHYGWDRKSPPYESFFDDQWGIGSNGWSAWAFGFVIGDGTGSAPPTRNRFLQIPFYFVIVSTGLFNAIVIGRHYILRKRSSLPNACSTCGYDLRSTPDRCPECGAMPLKMKAIQTEPLAGDRVWDRNW